MPSLTKFLTVLIPSLALIAPSAFAMNYKVIRCDQKSTHHNLPSVHFVSSLQLRDLKTGDWVNHGAYDMLIRFEQERTIVGPLSVEGHASLEWKESGPSYADKSGVGADGSAYSCKLVDSPSMAAGFQDQSTFAGVSKQLIDGLEIHLMKVQVNHPLVKAMVFSMTRFQNDPRMRWSFYAESTQPDGTGLIPLSGTEIDCQVSTEDERPAEL